MLGSIFFCFSTVFGAFLYMLGFPPALFPSLLFWCEVLYLITVKLECLPWGRESSEFLTCQPYSLILPVHLPFPPLLLGGLILIYYYKYNLYKYRLSEFSNFIFIFNVTFYPLPLWRQKGIPPQWYEVEPF